MVLRLLIAIFLSSLFLNGGHLSLEGQPATALFLSIVTLGQLVYFLLQRKRISLSMLICGLLPVVYLGPILFGTYESLNGSILRVFDMTAYAAFWFLLLSVASVKDRSNEINQGLIIFSYVVVISTIAGLSGLIQPKEFWLHLVEGLSGSTARLGSFIHYPNAFALLSIVLFFIHSINLLRNEDKTQRYINLFPLLPYALFLLLTESRAAWLVFGICFLVMLVLLKRSEQWRYLMISGSVFGVALIFVWQAELLIRGSIFLALLLMMISGGVAWAFTKWRISVSEKLMRIPIGIVSSVLVALAALDIYFKGLLFKVLPTALQTRLSMSGGSFTDRMIYWQDVFGASERFLFIGAGGNAWRELMYQLQSAPYISHALHSSLITILVEVGILGLLMLLGLMVLLFWRMWNIKTLWIVPTIAIVLHSLVDFTLSFALIGFLLLTFLGMEFSLPDWKFNISTKWMRIGKIASLSLVTILFIGVSLFSWRFQQASAKFGNGDVDAAIQYNPYAMEYRLVNPTIASLTEGLRYTPNHSYAFYRLAEFYETEGEMKLADQYFAAALKNDRFDQAKHLGYIAFLIEQGEIERANEIEAAYEKLRERDYPVRDQRGFLE